MKRIKYQLYIKLNEDVCLYFNSFSSKYLLLDKRKHELYQSLSLEEIEKAHPDLYSMNKL